MRRNTIFSTTIRNLSYPTYRNTYVHHPQYRNEYTEQEKNQANLKKLQEQRQQLVSKLKKLDEEILADQRELNAVAAVKQHWIKVVKELDAADIGALLVKVPETVIDDVMEAAIECKNTTAIQTLALKAKAHCRVREHLIHCIHTCNEEAAIALIKIMDKDELNLGHVDFDGFATRIPMLSIAAEVYMSLTKENGKDVAAKQSILSRLMIALIRNGASVYYDYGVGGYSVDVITAKLPGLNHFLTWTESMINKEQSFTRRKV